VHQRIFLKDTIASDSIMAAIVESLSNKKRMSPICLQWKEDPTSSYHRSPKKNTGSGLQELPSAVNTPNNNEGTVAQPQLAKRQRKKPALRNRDFYGHHKTYTDNKPL
jgi:hypothetical protein